MDITRLGSPRPRGRPLDQRDVSWPTRRALPLTPPVSSDASDCLRILGDRQTRRDFGFLSAKQLSKFLWHAARTRVSYRERNGRLFQSKPSPSAGGCHPHDLLIVRPSKEGLVAFIYDSNTHALGELRCRKQRLQHFAKQVAKVVPIQRGTIIWLIGQPQRTANLYWNPESLLWRDAGALIAVMAIVAEALNLSFCPVGITGDLPLSQLLRQRHRLYGFGGAIVGGRMTV
jgi:SagB-type dehydrogenase family enzyme